MVYFLPLFFYTTLKKYNHLVYKDSKRMVHIQLNLLLHYKQA